MTRSQKSLGSAKEASNTKKTKHAKLFVIYIYSIMCFKISFTYQVPQVGHKVLMKPSPTTTAFRGWRSRAKAIKAKTASRGRRISNRDVPARRPPRQVHDCRAGDPATRPSLVEIPEGIMATTCEGLYSAPARFDTDGTDNVSERTDGWTSPVENRAHIGNLYDKPGRAPQRVSPLPPGLGSHEEQRRPRPGLLREEQRFSYSSPTHVPHTGRLTLARCSPSTLLPHELGDKVPRAVRRQTSAGSARTQWQVQGHYPTPQRPAEGRGRCIVIVFNVLPTAADVLGRGGCHHRGHSHLRLGRRLVASPPSWAASFYTNKTTRMGEEYVAEEEVLWSPPMLSTTPIYTRGAVTGELME